MFSSQYRDYPFSNKLIIIFRKNIRKNCYCINMRKIFFNLLTSFRALADYTERFVSVGEPSNLSQQERAKLGSNWILGEVSRIMNANSIDIDDFGEKVAPERLARLATLNSRGMVNTATAKSMLEEMFNTGKDPDTILEKGERRQISDTQEIEGTVVEVITANPQAVADFEAGKEQALKFLVGQVMKATRGRANPQMVNELLKKKLGGD